MKISKENLKKYEEKLIEMQKVRTKIWRINSDVYDEFKLDRKIMNNKILALKDELDKKEDERKEQLGYYDLKFNEKEFNNLKRIIGRIKKLKEVKNGI